MMIAFSAPPAFSTASHRISLSALLVAVAALLAATGCAPDEPGASSCSSHQDCEVGTVCGAEGTCIETGCEFCEDSDDLICLENEDNPDGVCSVPECSSDEDCSASGESCNNGLCTDSQCETDEDCETGQSCNVFGECIDAGDTGMPEDGGMSDVADGGAEDAGDTGDTSTEPGDVDAGPADTGGDTGGGGDGGSCAEKESCPPESDPTAKKWSTEYCECVECTANSDCSGDKECRNGVCKAQCEQSCTRGSDTCSGSTPYCISGCCVECIGAADCSGDKICVDDVCTSSPDSCSPGDCPTDYECNTDSGQCEQSSSGQNCDPQNPNSCPQGEFCQNGSCQSPTGGGSCGMCKSDCTCPGSSTCSGNFVCTGCMGSSDCPSGQTCFPGLNICISF